MREAAAMNGNGAVMLGREMRLRLSPQHTKSLSAIAQRWGWQSPTALAEALLMDAIEAKARNIGFQHFLGVVAGAFCG